MGWTKKSINSVNKELFHRQFPDMNKNEAQTNLAFFVCAITRRFLCQAQKIPVVAMFAGGGGLELAWCKPRP